MRLVVFACEHVIVLIKQDIHGMEMNMSVKIDASSLWRMKATGRPDCSRVASSVENLRF